MFRPVLIIEARSGGKVSFSEAIVYYSNKQFSSNIQKLYLYLSFCPSGLDAGCDYSDSSPKTSFLLSLNAASKYFETCVRLFLASVNLMDSN